VGREFIQRGLLFPPLGYRAASSRGRVALWSSRSVTSRYSPAHCCASSSRSPATTRTRTGRRWAGRSPAAYIDDSQDPSGSACSTSRIRLAGTRHSRCAPGRHTPATAAPRGTPARPGPASPVPPSAPAAWPASSPRPGSRPAQRQGSRACRIPRARPCAPAEKRPLTLPRCVPGRPNAWSLAAVSAASQHVPSTANSRSPATTPPGWPWWPAAGRWRQTAPAAAPRPAAPAPETATTSPASATRPTGPARAALDQVPQHLQVRRGREQRHRQHEIHHQPRRQQPPTLLGPIARGHHPIHHIRRIHPGQHPEPGQLRHTLGHRYPTPHQPHQQPRQPTPPNATALGLGPSRPDATGPAHPT
jgi:hypothetical protein